MVPPLDSPSLASPLVSTHDPVTWPVPWVPGPLIDASRGPRTVRIAEGSEANATISDPYRALSTGVWFIPPLVLGSLQPRAHCQNPPVNRISRPSRVKIRPHALRIHPFVPRHKYLATPGYTALPRSTSSEGVRVPSSTLDLCAVCTDHVYSSRNPIFRLTSVSLQPCPQNLPYPAENASSACAWTRADELRFPTGRICSRSLDIALPPYHPQSSDPGTSIRFSMPRTSSPLQQDPPLSTGTRLIPGFAAVFEQTRFPRSGTFYVRTYLQSPASYP